MNDSSPNTARINAQLEALKHIRKTGSMRVGWEEGNITPPQANALVKAGLIEVRTTEHGKFAFPLPQPR